MKFNNVFANTSIKLSAAFLFCFLLSFIASSFIIQPQGTKAVTGLSLVTSPIMALDTSTNNLDIRSAPHDSTTVYYGAKMNLESGTYSNTVRYTATANITTIPTPAIVSVTPNTGAMAGGSAIQIIGTGFTVKAGFT